MGTKAKRAYETVNFDHEKRHPPPKNLVRDTNSVCGADFRGNRKTGTHESTYSKPAEIEPGATI